MKKAADSSTIALESKRPPNLTEDFCVPFLLMKTEIIGLSILPSLRSLTMKLSYFVVSSRAVYGIKPTNPLAALLKGNFGLRTPRNLVSTVVD